MKRSEYRATNILLLLIYCLWCHVQPTAGGKCSGQWAIHACAGGNGKRSDVDDLERATELGRAVEGPDTEEGRGGERTGGGGGGRVSDGFGGAREGDDLRSEFSDLRQLLGDITSRRFPHPPPVSHPRPAPLDSALDRLRSLLRVTGPDADDQEGNKEKEELSSSDINRRYINRDNLNMLRRILDDVEGRLDSQRSHDRAPDSVGVEQGYDEAEDSYYSLQKRAADQ